MKYTSLHQASRHAEFLRYGPRRSPQHFDFTDLKLYGEAAFASAFGNPFKTQVALATIAEKQALEKQAGTKLTSEEVSAIKLDNQKSASAVLQKSVDEHIAKPLTAFFDQFKMIIIIVLILAILYTVNKFVAV